MPELFYSEKMGFTGRLRCYQSKRSVWGGDHMDISDVRLGNCIMHGWKKYQKTMGWLTFLLDIPIKMWVAALFVKSN